MIHNDVSYLDNGIATMDFHVRFRGDDVLQLHQWRYDCDAYFLEDSFKSNLYIYIYIYIADWKATTCI